MMDDAALAALNGRVLTVGELLAKWGQRIRSHETVRRIRLDLERVGLATDPFFGNGPVSQWIRIVPLAEEEHTSASPGSQDGNGEGGTTDGVEPEPDELPEASMKVGHLPAARGGVVRVSPTSSFEEATTLMMKHDYSQLPVLAGPCSLRGVVSWRSIARMYAFNVKATLEHATEQSAQVVAVHQDLMTILPAITTYDFVLVQNEDGHICGILTTADLATQFENVARPFFAVGEIERRLRNCLGPVFDGAGVKKATRGRCERVDQMTFGQYQKMLGIQEFWKQLDWPAVDQGLFVDELNSVREIRNEVMHFRPTPLTPDQDKQLAQFLGMLRTIRP